MTPALFLSALLSAPAAHAGDAPAASSPAAEADDPVACRSTDYQNFLGSLDENLFGAAVRLCLDDLRQSAAKKNGTAPGTAVPFTFHAVPPADIPGDCAQGDLAAMKGALQNQLASCAKFPAEKMKETREFACRTYTRQEWCVQTNQKLLGLANGAPDFASFLQAARSELDWVKSDGWQSGAFQGKTQFTGYHSPPPLEASPVPTFEYNYPLYRKPADLATVDAPASCGSDDVTGKPRRVCQKLPDGALQPFPDRDAIDNHGALAGQGLEIAWVKGPVDAAFLMVEGSGSINLHQADGSVVKQRVNYDAANGRTLNMLGRVILCLGGQPEDYSSLTGIKTYLGRHGDILKTILGFDQSYVFFRPDTKGPFGADSIPVTGRYSFATDRRIIPTGAAMLFHTKDPGAKGGTCPELSSLGIAQDSGGAIVGPHVDWYLGEGDEAQSQADALNQGGDLFLALPKGGGQPVAGCVPAGAAPEGARVVQDLATRPALE